MPSSDATNFDIPCWSMSYGIRFDPETGRPRKVGGNIINTFDYNATVSGTIRTVYSNIINQKIYTILGTNTSVYGVIGSQLTNIGPLDTATVAAANSLSTHYGTLAANPLTTVNGSKTVIIADTDAAKYKPGDIYTLSGATTTNGIPNTDINKPQIVRSIGTNQITIITATAATSNGTGGGAAVVRSDGLITLTKAAHGLVNNQRVKINGATATGGITALQINLEFNIRNVTTNTFDVMTGGTSTSAATAGGGASVTYNAPIAAGQLNQGHGQGYGAGLYGVGLYGTALVSSTGETYPRIWFADRFGDNIIMTAGNQSKVYTWSGTTVTGPTPIANAPATINYAFVSDNILVTLGYQFENQIFASDQGDYTNWTASSTNQVFQDVIEGSGRFISHVRVDGYNLLFTQTQTWTFKYVGIQSGVWQTLILDDNIGIIGPMARFSVNGIGYWMSAEGFHMFRGGKVESIPSNLANVSQSTCLRYVFDDMNYSQRFKFFCEYNDIYDELRFHYCSSNSNECDRVAVVSLKLFAWWPDVVARTAAEYPQISLSNPRTAYMSNLYTEESGNDDHGSALAWSLSTKKFFAGKNASYIVGVIPDSVQSGTVSVTLNAYDFPQSTLFRTKQFNVTQTTDRIPVSVNGRVWQYTFSGSELGQSFLMGQWLEEMQAGPSAP